MATPSFSDRFLRALAVRADLFDDRHERAFRLFSGFYEGWPDIVIELFARTAVVHNYADQPETAAAAVEAARALLLERLPWLKAILLKERKAEAFKSRQGRFIFGDQADRRILEGNVWYAIDLQMHQDSGFYMDTRWLRRWALKYLRDKSVLNAFAYTGSLGVAAKAGGAGRVVHLDLDRQFLNVAKVSYEINKWPVDKADFVRGDFFPEVSRLKREGARFDCIFLDPPFFSTTAKGTVDGVDNFHRLINKVRPLVADNGWLVAINNALFLSGKDYLYSLEALGQDGYMVFDRTIDAPPDVTGYPQTRVDKPPADPTPFNHPTKIAVLRVHRKDAGFQPVE